MYNIASERQLCYTFTRIRNIKGALAMNKETRGKNDFDYEIDDYDRLRNVERKRNHHQSFTNKVTLKKVEFDYEEDPFEPEKNK